MGTETGRTTVIDLKWPTPRKILTVLLVVAAFFGGMHVVAPYTGIEFIEIHFHLDKEETLATWWSSLQLFVLGVGLLTLANSYRPDHHVARSLRIGASIAVFFSLDEVASLHENLEQVLDRFEWIPRFAGKGHWMTVYAVAGLIAFGFMLPGLRRLWRNRRPESLRFLIGAGAFVAGGIVAELFFYYGTDTVLIEEGLEIVGVAVMIWATSRALVDSTLRVAP